MRAPILGLLGILAGLPVASTAQAQSSCYPTFSAAFVRLPQKEAAATTQGVADMEVRSQFGPRPEQCEEGAYQGFMELFRDFAKSAMRAAPAKRDKLLRLAIAAVQQAPAKVPAKEAKQAASSYKQVKSDLSATADDVGFEKTPLLGQLLEAMTRLGPPMAAAAVAELAPPPANPTPSTTATAAMPSTSGGVQSVRVPTDPLPPWAVIKLYEMRDHIKAQDLAAIQIKLQDIINWMELSTQPKP